MKLGEWEKVDSEVQRCLVELGHNIMAVKVRFQKGAIGSLHQHPHEQLTVVSAGAFRFTVGAETRVVKTGDTLYVAGNTPHGTEALEDGELLDIFTPLRMDMLEPVLEPVLAGGKV